MASAELASSIHGHGRTSLSQTRFSVTSLLSLSAAALGTSVLFGCSAPGISLLQVPAETRATLAPEREETLQKLDALEVLLTDFEALRCSTLKKYGILLIVPEIGERYRLALAHHRQLCTEVKDRKERLLGGLSESDLVAINTWCDSHQEALGHLHQTAMYVLDNHELPARWRPPAGFEYLEP